MNHQTTRCDSAALHFTRPWIKYSTPNNAIFVCILPSPTHTHTRTLCGDYDVSPPPPLAAQKLNPRGCLKKRGGWATQGGGGGNSSTKYFFCGTYTTPPPPPAAGREGTVPRAKFFAILMLRDSYNIVGQTKSGESLGMKPNIEEAYNKPSPRLDSNTEERDTGNFRSRSHIILNSLGSVSFEVSRPYSPLARNYFVTFKV